MGKKYTEEQEKEIAYLKSNYEMYERTKEEARIRGTEKSVQRIELAQQDVLSQLKAIDENLVSELKQNNELGDNGLNNDLLEGANDFFDGYKGFSDSKAIDIEKLKDEVGLKTDYEFNNVDSSVQYDIVSLPSNGQCYKDKFSRVPVSYLTAYDENFITSPNLYKDGLVIDYLLKHKVMNKNINIEELCSGDVDAITLFLRITSYGPEYPIIARDPESGQEIEAVIDLSELKMKDFNLVGDENGYFDFELPSSKDVVKFKFLTRKDKRILEKLSNNEDYAIKAMKVRSNVNELISLIKKDDLLNGKDKQLYVDNLSKLETWCLKMNEKEKMPFNKTITNKLELSVVSVNGETDRDYISKYVKNMSAKDALMLRRYIMENEPGVNFEISIERPLSLGGGSFKTFLEWEDTIFLNIT